jgi:hypothetical protein
MSLRYSKHAREQMELRGVTEPDVEQAIAHPIGAPEAGQPGTLWIRGFAVGGRILKVNVPALDRDFVITVAWPN